MEENRVDIQLQEAWSYAKSSKKDKESGTDFLLPDATRKRFISNNLIKKPNINNK